MKSTQKFAVRGLMAALVSLSSHAGALSVFGTTETRVQAYGDSLFSGIGYVSLEDAATKKSRACTGFLINRRWALTAAHCINTATAKKISFEFDRNDQAFEFESEVIQAFTLPDFENTGRILHKDWALLQLKTEVPKRFASYMLANSKQITEGQNAMTIGYPFDVGNGDVRMMSSNCTIRKVFDDQIASDCETMQGNSGGPLFVQMPDGVWIVAGITSTQYIDANEKTIGRTIYRDEIANHFTNVGVYLGTMQATIRQNPAP